MAPTTERVIVLARHGPPALDRPSFATRADFGRWMTAYDAAEVIPGAVPATEHQDLMHSLRVVLSSGVPRAESSARLIGLTTEVMPEGKLVECPLPTPPVPLVRMPIDAWWTLSRILWLMGYAPDGLEHRRDAWKRVSEVADTLVGLAAEHGRVGVLAHGWTNHWIGLSLRRRGWVKRERSGYGPWSRIVFVPR